MSEYKPSTIVVKLAEKLHANPIAEHIHPDGRIVIVFEDGRKLSFDRDDITRTLTEPAIAIPEMPPLEGASLTMVGDLPTTEKTRKRGKKENPIE